MELLPGMKKKNKEKMTEEKAFEIIKEWGEDLEVRLNDDNFKAVQEELFMAVRNERLSYDDSTEIFTYVLKKPIEMKDKSGSIDMLKIQDCTMSDKRDISKSKNPIDQNVAMFDAYCTDSDGLKIPLGFLQRIKTTDQNIINGVILGFFVQAVPSADSVS